MCNCELIIVKLSFFGGKPCLLGANVPFAL